MRNNLILKTLFLIALNATVNASESLESKTTESVFEIETVAFTPPKNWELVDQTKLPASVMAMVVGKGSYSFPPSLNLGVHKNAGNLKEFLKFVKEINNTDGIDWKDLGTIKTLAGDASLSQLDTKTEWGAVREMQVILIYNNDAYILTAAALRNEFPKFYKDFFASMRSLRIEKKNATM